MNDSESAGNDTQPPKEGEMYSSDELLSKLQAALQKHGDFPASAKVISQLRSLTSNSKTTANQLTEIILTEPSLGIRVLRLVNSSYYRRSKPIMTISQAVIQIGMRPLAELCAGLVLLQRFVPAARQGGAFANCLQKTILTSLLSRSISEETSNVPDSERDEFGYLAGSCYELGTLLLAYYFPRLYETAIKRAEAKNQKISQSITELTGITPLELSLSVIESLNLPEFYKEVLLASDNPPKEEELRGLAPERAKALRMASSLHAAKKISNIIVFSKDKSELDSVLKDINQKTGIKIDAISDVIGELPNSFRHHCSSLEVSLPTLPEFVTTYSSEEKPVAEADSPGEENQFSKFVDEIRQVVESREPTAAVITTVMETFAWGLKFDRVLLLLVSPDKKKLMGRMLLGDSGGLDPKDLSSSLEKDSRQPPPEIMAYAEGRPIFQGDPILEGGWPFCVIPIGFGEKAVGVIYADKTSSGEETLPNNEQAAVGVLAELLDRSINMNS